MKLIRLLPPKKIGAESGENTYIHDKRMTFCCLRFYIIVPNYIIVMYATLFLFLCMIYTVDSWFKDMLFISIARATLMLSILSYSFLLVLSSLFFPFPFSNLKIKKNFTIN